MRALTVRAAMRRDASSNSAMPPIKPPYSLIVLLKPSSYSRFSSCGEGKIKFIHNRRETFAESVRLVRVSVGSAENSRGRRKGEVRIKDVKLRHVPRRDESGER